MISSYREMIASKGPSTMMSGEQRDCAVRAISASFDMPYDEAHQFAENAWSRERKRGTSTQNILSFFRSYKEYGGKSIQQMSNRSRYPYKDGRVVECQSTLGKFAKSNPEGTYFVLLRSHATVIKGGVVLDNWSPGARINYVWKISDANQN